MQCKVYCPHIANDVYKTVIDCGECAGKRVNKAQRQHLKLFPASSLLDFIATDIPGPLLKTKNSNKFVVTMTDRYSRLTRAVPTSKTSATHILSISYDNFILPYGIPTYLLTDNSTQSVSSEFFKTICHFLGMKHLKTIAYHHQTSEQAERYNRMLIARLHHYRARHQHGWDSFVQPLTYMKITQVNRST